jgi:hypothetical protein
MLEKLCLTSSMWDEQNVQEHRTESFRSEAAQNQSAG